MKQIEYKGYKGSCEPDIENDSLFGKILFINDLITYEATTIAQLKQEFQLAVDGYLDMCKRIGRNPQQPYSGQFNVRVGDDLHRRAAIRAQKENLKLNAIVVRALEQYLEDRVVTHSHTHTHTHTVKVEGANEIQAFDAKPYGGAIRLEQYKPIGTREYEH